MSMHASFGVEAIPLRDAFVSRLKALTEVRAKSGMLLNRGAGNKHGEQARGTSTGNGKVNNRNKAFISNSLIFSHFFPFPVPCSPCFVTFQNLRNRM